MNGIEAAEEFLDIDGIDDQGLWWADHRTRPYMRALVFLGSHYMNTGQHKLGEEIYLDLLDMNPLDNLGIRYELMEYALHKKKWSIVKSILNEFSDDGGLLFYHAKYIYLFFTIGKKSKTKKAILTAHKKNPHVLRILVGGEDDPGYSEYYSPGSPEEATLVLPFLSEYFIKHRELLKWVFEVMTRSGIDLLNE